MGEQTETLIVNEIFRSVQGEGLLIGQPSIFLRLALCNVNCPMCDTDYHQGVRVQISELVKAIRGSYSRDGMRHLVITGGEPYIHPGLEFFLDAIGSGYHITVETSGSVIPGTFSRVDLLSVSPKFCSLKPGEGKGLDEESLLASFRRILTLPRNEIQVKLVWDGSPEDVPEFLPGLITELQSEQIPVFFQPITKGSEFSLPEYLVEFPKVVNAVKATFGCWPRVLPQMHKFFSWR